MAIAKKTTHIVETVIKCSNFVLTLTAEKAGEVYNYNSCDIDIDVKDQERVSLKLTKQELEDLVEALSAIGYTKRTTY